LVDVCNEFLLSRARAGRSDAYLKLSRAHCAAFLKTREGRPVATLSSVEVEDWLYQTAWAPKTRAVCLLFLKALFGFAVARGYVAGNVALGVEAPTVEPAAPVLHTPAQVATVLGSLQEPSVQRWFALRYFAGLRASEALSLTEAEIQTERGFVEITAAKAKTRRRRLVTIQPALRSFLDATASRGGCLPLRQPSNRIAAAIAGAGVPWAQNVTRHSFVSYHLAGFGSAARTALEAGHSEAMLFGVYREICTAESAAAFWALRSK
jgi:integrase